MLRAGCPRPARRCLRSKLLPRLHENRVVDGQVVFHFGEFDGEVCVLDDVDGEGHFHAIDFAIVLVFDGLGHLARGVPFFSAHQQPGDVIKVETSRTTVARRFQHQREALVLEAPRNGSPRRFYFDNVTGLLVRTEEWNAAGKMTEAVEYQDYREIDGVKVPFTIHIVQDAHFTIKLTEVKHNLRVDDAIFVKPRKSFGAQASASWSWASCPQHPSNGLLCAYLHTKR